MKFRIIGSIVFLVILLITVPFVQSCSGGSANGGEETTYIEE